MPLCKVTVTKPLNRLIYIDGNYEESAGNSSERPFNLLSGGHILETLNGDDRVDHRADITITMRDRKLSIELEPVDPPERVK